MTNIKWDFVKKYIKLIFNQLFDFLKDNQKIYRLYVQSDTIKKLSNHLENANLAKNDKSHFQSLLILSSHNNLS